MFGADYGITGFDSARSVAFEHIAMETPGTYAMTSMPRVPSDSMFVDISHTISNVMEKIKEWCGRRDSNPSSNLGKVK